MTDTRSSTAKKAKKQEKLAEQQQEQGKEQEESVDKVRAEREENVKEFHNYRRLRDQESKVSDQIINEQRQKIELPEAKEQLKQGEIEEV